MVSESAGCHRRRWAIGQPLIITKPHLHLAVARLAIATVSKVGQTRWPASLKIGARQVVEDHLGLQVEQIAQPAKEFHFDTVLCAPTTGQACDTTLGASQGLPVPDPAVSSEPESSFHHVHRQNRSPAIAPARARCPDGRADWPPAPALDPPKAVSRPFAPSLFLAPSHQECSPGQIHATTSGRPASVPSRRP